LGTSLGFVPNRVIADPDDRSTWPLDVADWVAVRADRLRGTTEWSSDLKLATEDEAGFRTLFAGAKLRAYHCTRLLDHEIATIRERGLRLLTLELVEEKVEAAFNAGAFTVAERDTLRATHVFAQGAQRLRENRLALCMGRQAFADPSGFESLLSIWGGEAIYMGTPQVLCLPLPHGWPDLRKVGRPAIIVAAIESSPEHWLDLHWHHPLGQVFVGIELGLEDAYSDVDYLAPILPEDVLAIWQPRDVEYGGFPGLPQD
jgi:hypothetical protein